jgi:hypothetical protein
VPFPAHPNARDAMSESARPIPRGPRLFDAIRYVALLLDDASRPPLMSAITGL